MIILLTNPKKSSYYYLCYFIDQQTPVIVSEGLGSAVLEFDPVSRKDAGRFHCAAANTVGQATPITATLVVHRELKGIKRRYERVFLYP